MLGPTCEPLKVWLTALYFVDKYNLGDGFHSKVIHIICQFLCITGN